MVGCRSTPSWSGRRPEGVGKELAAYGVRNVHHADGDDFDRFSGAATTAAVVAAREAAGSVVVMAGGTNRGNEVMARVATRIGVAMAANVVSFQGLSPFVVTRQVVGGAALEEMRLSQRPAVFTVAGHAVEPEPAPEPGSRQRSSPSRSSSPPPTSPSGWSPSSAPPTTSPAA